MFAKPPLQNYQPTRRQGSYGLRTPTSWLVQRMLDLSNTLITPATYPGTNPFFPTPQTNQTQFHPTFQQGHWMCQELVPGWYAPEEVQSPSPNSNEAMPSTHGPLRTATQTALMTMNP